MLSSQSPMRIRERVVSGIADQFVVEADIAAPAATVWEGVVDPSARAQWWRDDVELEPRPGGAFSEPYMVAGNERRTSGRILGFHPPHGLVLSWSDDDWDFETIVLLMLRETESGCRIKIVHDGWLNAPDVGRNTLVDAHRAGWTDHLDRLRSYAEGLVSEVAH